MSADTDQSATVARRFLALGLGEVAARLLGFAAMVVAARALGAPMFGIIGVATAVTLYLNRIVDWGFELGLGVREVAARPADSGRILPTLLLARLGLAVTAIGGTALVGLLLLPAPDGSTLLLSSLSLLGTGLGARWALLGLGEHRLAALATLAAQVLTAVLLLLLVHGPGDVSGVPQAQLGGELLLSLVALLVLRRRGVSLRVQFDRQVLRPLVARGGALATSAVLGLVIYNVSFLFLRAVKGPAAVGYLSAAVALVTFFLNVGTAYSMSLLPSLAALVADRPRQVTLLQTAALHVTALALPIAVGGSLLALPLVALLYGPGYLPAAIPLALLLWSIPICVLRDLPLMALQSTGHESVVLRVTVWAALLHLILNVLMVPRWGLVGAATAGLITETVRLGLAFSAVRGEGFRLPGLGRFRPVLVASALMGLVVQLVPGGVPGRVLAGAVVYLVSLVALGAIRVQRGGRIRVAL
ncbi:MAG: polysaccharide biosynthesis C-terminal domain-containing protein [Gemmatimonadales bacterium]